MNGFVTLIPFILIRIVLFKIKDENAYKRAQKFAPLSNSQRKYYYIYQLCQLSLFIVPFFYTVNLVLWQKILGLVIYIVGFSVTSASVYYFSKPSVNGLNQSGIYRLSRHPMYVGYFCCYLGIGLLMNTNI